MALTRLHEPSKSQSRPPIAFIARAMIAVPDWWRQVRMAGPKEDRSQERSSQSQQQDGKSLAQACSFALHFPLM